PDRGGGAGEHHELGELTAGQVLILRPVKREIAPPLRLALRRPAIGRRGGVVVIDAAHGESSPNMPSSSGSAGGAGGPPSSSLTGMKASGRSRGAMKLTLVVMICAPNWKLLTGAEAGRSRAISSSVP